MRLLGTLQAPTSDDEDRVRRYVLLPYGGAVGMTNLGALVATKGVLTLPPVESFVVNTEHDETRPVAKGVDLTDTEEGLLVAVRALRTHAGDDYLVETSEGVRAGISVEVTDPVVRGGRLLGGYLDAAGAVVRPAWDAARLAAGKVPQVPDEGDAPDTRTPGPPDDEDEDEESTPSGDDEDTEDEEGDNVTQLKDDTDDTAAAAPKLAAARAKATRQIGARDAFELLAALRQGDQSAMAALEPAGRLFAALTIVSEANGAAAMQPQWIGEAFATTYERRIIPLLTQAPLTSRKIQGYRWTLKPTVAKFAGPPAEINSTPVALEPVQEDAVRWAGGNRIDRSYVDFNDTEMIGAYLKALSDSYHEETDDEALVTLLAAAVPTVAGVVPADVPPGLVSIVDGALAVVKYGQPSYAVVATDSWRTIMLSKSIDALAYITTSLSLEEGSLNGFRIVPHAGMAAGSVLVGIKAAATHYELPGSPLRVDAQAVAVGAIDEAVHGYDATLINDQRGLALVTPAV